MSRAVKPRIAVQHKARLRKLPNPETHFNRYIYLQKAPDIDFLKKTGRGKKEGDSGVPGSFICQFNDDVVSLSQTADHSFKQVRGYFRIFADNLMKLVARKAFYL